MEEIAAPAGGNRRGALPETDALAALMSDLLGGGSRQSGGGRSVTGSTTVARDGAAPSQPPAGEFFVMGCELCV